MAVRRPKSHKQLNTYRQKIEPLVPGFAILSQHIVITDPEGNILYMNKAAEEATGYGLKESFGKNPGDLWGGNMSDAFYSNMWTRVKKHKQPFMGEVRNTKKDGTECWQEILISPVLGAKKEIKFLIAIEPIITERKRKEEFRRDFISMISHRLRIPLTNTRWTLELLLNQEKIKPAEKKSLEVLYQQNKNIIDLVADLLILSRIEQGRIVVEKVDLEKEIKTIIAVAQANHPKVTFTFHPPKEIIRLNVNKTVALQIFFNIIMNAAEYSDQTTGKVNIQLKLQGRRGVFVCQDNGIGIPKKDQARVFSKFFRGSNAAQLKKDGTGLGLFIVKLITDNLGWKVSFTSAKGQGVSFTVSFPVR